jgi:hypothetical protein
MFVFVRQMQEFNWTPYWREHPKDIAELIERAHAYQYGANTTFWEDNLEDGSGKEEFIAIWIGMRFPAHAPPLKLAAQEAEKLPLQLLQPHSEAYCKIGSPSAPSWRCRHCTATGGDWQGVGYRPTYRVYVSPARRARMLPAKNGTPQPCTEKGRALSF